MPNRFMSPKHRSSTSWRSIPQYAGYQEDLNAPAAVQRPAGVLNAATIWIESDNLQNILIQNTGTAETPAGFLAKDIFVNDDERSRWAAGIDRRGRQWPVHTEGGTLTGIAVRDALVAGEDLTPFTANSTINGCLLDGRLRRHRPPVTLPAAASPDRRASSDEIMLIERRSAAAAEFGNESIIDDNDEDDRRG